MICNLKLPMSLHHPVSTTFISDSSHAANTNESSRKYECLMSQTWLVHAYTRVHPLWYQPPSFRILVMPPTRSYAANTNVSRREYECFMSRIWMSHAAHIPLKEEMQIKRATNYTALLRKMTYADQACCTHSMKEEMRIKIFTTAGISSAIWSQSLISWMRGTFKILGSRDY